MKKRLLAFFLVFAMVFGMMPVTALAAETEEPEQPFTSIVTDTGAEVTTKFVGMIPAETEQQTYNDGPYYHVTVPAGTASVKVTYPEDIAIAGNPAYSYTLSVPDYTLGYGRDTYAVTENDDGSHTVTIPIADYLLADGTGTGISLEKDTSFDPITFFTFSYAQAVVSHSVTLTEGTGYTLTGKATVEDGADYTFTVTIADGYDGTGMVVKANGEALTANEDGSYTVSGVSADLTITVEGVEAAAPSVEFRGPASGNLEVGKKITCRLNIKPNKTVSSLEAVFRYDPKVVSFSSLNSEVFSAEEDSTQGTLTFSLSETGRDKVSDNNVALGICSFDLKALGDATITLTSVKLNGEEVLTENRTLTYTVGYKVTLPKGENYTVTGDAYAPVGGSYSFSVAFADGYEGTVKANDTVLTAGEDGTYTVENVASDLTVTVDAARVNRVPVLKEGVSATKEDFAPVGYAYNLTELQCNEIFEDPDGDKLDYTSYYYQRSTDGGETWGVEQHFEPSLFGFTTIQFTEKVKGTYMYRFRAYDGTDYSEDTWTLTLHVSDDAPLNFTFYVGRDQNYNKTTMPYYPKIELYKTAGFDDALYDYVGYWMDGEGTKHYIYNPADYTITQTDGVYYADGERLYDYCPIDFTNSLFGAEGEGALESGDLVTYDYTEYSAYYASIPVGKYSYRAYGYNTETEEYDIYLGGQTLNLPTEANVDGGTGGGTSIFLRLIAIYTNTKKVDGTFFGEDDYRIEVTMPIMGGMVHSGTPYVSGSTTRHPFMMYAAGNASLYNIYAYPTDTDNYIFTQLNNQTSPAGNTVQTKTVTIGTAITLTATVPADADFGLYFQYNNFNTKEVEPVGEWVVNGATKTASFKMTKGSTNYTWRLSDSNHVTRAGWLKLSTATEMTFDFEGASTDKTSHTPNLGSAVKTRDEADLLVNLDAAGFEAVSGTTRVRAYRHWELINNDAGNIMVEPDFRWKQVSGNAVIETVDGGNTADNWADITPGTSDSIITVYYDAIEMEPGNYGTHGGFFPATNPERVGVIVIPGTGTTVGSADANVDFNMAAGGTTTRSMDWDYNGDTWFYLASDETPTLDFTVNATGDVTVQTAFVTANAAMNVSVSGWQTQTASDGIYNVDLSAFNTSGNGKGGTVIIRMTDSTGTSYRLVRVAKISIDVSNVTNPGEPFMPGDQVKLTFDGMYRNINKTSGIFNPTTLYVRYTNDETEYSGALGQYQQMDNVSFTITIPEELEFSEGGNETEFSLTNGYIFGSMYSAANPFGTIYQMTDTGVGTNFNAVTVNFYSSHVPDTVITVDSRVVYDVALVINDSEGVVEGCTVTVKNPSGTVVEPNAETGLYEDLAYGEYSVVIAKAGYMQTITSFKLGSADGSTAVDGKVTKTFTLEKAAEGAWDGISVTEPATDANGIYQIGTGAELAWFAQTVNAGTNTSSAVLTADIDLARYFWTPIGNSTNNFKGNFDGAGHTVSNMAISYTTAATSVPYQGLFGYVSGTSNSELIEIKDLTVRGTLVLNNGKNVYGANSGGIIGQAKYAKLSGLTSNVDVTLVRSAGNWQHIGGVVGYLESGSITNCANLGTVSGYNYVGGIVGFADRGCLIDGCYNSGDVSGYENIGGIVGNLSPNGEGETPNTLQNCYNTGAVTASYRYAGGLIGYLYATTTAAKNATTLKNSYSTGTVTAGNNYAGAVVANATKASVIENVYYLDSACGAAFGTDAGTHSAAARTADELKALTADLGEAFGIDSKNINSGYPILMWQDGAIAVPEEPEVPEEPTIGDMDGNGKVDSTDAARVYTIVNGDAELTEELLALADVNKDGRVDSLDATLIYRIANGIT